MELFDILQNIFKMNSHFRIIIKKKNFSALHLLIVAALTKCHKLGSLKQQKLVLSQSGVQKSESKVAVE